MLLFKNDIRLNYVSIVRIKMNKTRRQVKEYKLRMEKLNVYKKELDIIIQDIAYYTRIVNSDKGQYVNIKEIKTMLYHIINYKRFLTCKISRIEKC